MGATVCWKDFGASVDLGRGLPLKLMEQHPTLIDHRYNKKENANGNKNKDNNEDKEMSPTTTTMPPATGKGMTTTMTLVSGKGSAQNSLPPFCTSLPAP